VQHTFQTGDSALALAQSQINSGENGGKTVVEVAFAGKGARHQRKEIKSEILSI